MTKDTVLDGMDKGFISIWPQYDGVANGDMSLGLNDLSCEIGGSDLLFAKDKSGQTIGEYYASHDDDAIATDIAEAFEKERKKAPRKYAGYEATLKKQLANYYEHPLQFDLTRAKEEPLNAVAPSTGEAVISNPDELGFEHELAGWKIPSSKTLDYATVSSASFDAISAFEKS